MLKPQQSYIIKFYNNKNIRQNGKINFNIFSRFQMGMNNIILFDFKSLNKLKNIYNCILEMTITFLVNIVQHFYMIIFNICINSRLYYLVKSYIRYFIYIKIFFLFDLANKVLLRFFLVEYIYKSK